MKNFLVFGLMLGIFLFILGSTMAFDTASYLGTKEDGQASIASLHAVSSPNSARLSAPFDNLKGPEGRVRIEFPNHDFTLNDLNTLSWKQYVEKGYLSHVDVLLDLNGNEIYDSGVDDALVFEGAKVNPSYCDAGSYPTGALTTFGSVLGDEINSGSYAWLSSGPSGPCDEAFGTSHNTLTEWKSGITIGSKTISGTNKVIALEFEVDGWIAESEAYLDDIYLNGGVIEDFDSQTTQVDIEDVIKAVITPLTLDFGTIAPGNTKSGPNIGIDVTGSNTDVQVAISDVTGFPFNTGLSVNGESPTLQLVIFTCSLSGDVCTFSNNPAVWTTSLSVPSGASAGLKQGTIIYTITGA